MCPSDEYDVEVEENIHLINITKDDMDSIVYLLLECSFEDCYDEEKEEYSTEINSKISSCIVISEMILDAVEFD